MWKSCTAKSLYKRKQDLKLPYKLIDFNMPLNLIVSTVCYLVKSQVAHCGMINTKDL